MPFFPTEADIVIIVHIASFLVCVYGLVAVGMSVLEERDRTLLERKRREEWWAAEAIRQRMQQSVAASQKSLHRMGYLKGNPEIVIDGHAGPKTKAAVNAWAKDVWADWRQNNPRGNR